MKRRTFLTMLTALFAARFSKMPIAPRYVGVIDPASGQFAEKSVQYLAIMGPDGKVGFYPYRVPTKSALTPA